MQNPFETGHVKNYLLMYASVVVIMVLFFIAATLLRDVKKFDKKVFTVKKEQAVEIPHAAIKEVPQKSETKKTKFKVLQKGY